MNEARQNLTKMAGTMMVPSRPPYAFLAVLSLLASSPVPSGAFWKKEEEKKPESAPVRNDNNGVFPDDVSVEYGVDVSFPMHYSKASTNYAWLPHNLDPEHNKVPEELKGEVVQPLGDRQKFYEDFLDGCKEHWGARGAEKCQMNEDDRIAMTLRQPQSMQVSSLW